MACFLLLLPSVFACGYFEIDSEYGVPVFNSYGYLIINGSKYPADQKMILYNLTVINYENVGVQLTFVPTSDLINYVYGTSGYVGPTSQKIISMNVYVDGPFKEGIIYVEGSCSNGFVQGVIPVRILGRGNSPPETCKNIITSCGIFPNCTDLTKINGCYNGYNRDYYCSNNEIIYNSQCTPYCCGLIGGSCGNGKCNDPSTTTTTIPTTSTTTIPQTTTTTIPGGTSGCYNGYYRNYYFSGGKLKYSETCTNYCCGLVGGTCNGGMCSGSSTTTTTTTSTTTSTTIPATTTTTLPSTTTTIPSNCNNISSLNGCYNGYYRSYYCSNNIPQYSQTCTNYCCNRAGGVCQGPTCSGSSTTTTTTTTTLPSSTTTTIPSNCNNAYAFSLNGCYNGYYRNYYCSNNHLEYSQTCTNYCCGLINGKCRGSACVA